MSAVVIVGAGQAGFQTAVSLRDLGYLGAVTVVGNEIHPPYQRPPLSKAYLSGVTDDGGVHFRPAAFFADRKIELMMGETVTGIHRSSRNVALASGKLLPYDHLVLAMGARNRMLPVGHDGLVGVLYLRTLDDAAALRAQLSGARRIVVLGAGFIGLEFAAVAANRKHDVTIVEAADRPMARVLSPLTSSFFRTMHEAAGVRFIFGAQVASIAGLAGQVAGVMLGDGRSLPADLVLVGIGAIPNDELAVAAGLSVSNGIEVDDQLVTSDSAISAIGDCACLPSRHQAGARLRIESVQNALDQGRCVARAIMGQPETYAAVPWFWSDQGRHKLQIVGIGSATDTPILRGSPESGSFSVFCYAGEQLRAVESVNRAQDHMVARRLLAQGRGLTPSQASDLNLDLRATLQRNA